MALVFILLGIILCWYFKKRFLTFQEAVANFGTALGNQTMNVLVAAGEYVLYGYLWEKYRLIVPERWIGSLLLWHMIINWAGIMESKPWLFFSEVFRLVIITSFLINFSADSMVSSLQLFWRYFP